MNRRFVILCKPVQTTFALAALVFLLLGNSCFGRGRSVLREDGLGRAKIGMTLDQLKAAIPGKVEEEESGSDSCFYVHALGDNKAYFMMIDGRLARIDVKSPGIQTSTGIQVGDSEERVQQVYGSRMKLSPHKYIDTGHYLTVRSADGHLGVRFETENGKLLTFYAGTYEAIQYVEGCS